MSAWWMETSDNEGGKKSRACALFSSVNEILMAATKKSLKLENDWNLPQNKPFHFAKLETETKEVITRSW